MTARVSTWIKRQPLLAFYLLAFAITWLGWLPQAAHSRGRFPFDSPLFYILGGVGPLLAVFLVRWASTGSTDVGELFRPYLRWRVGTIWYLAALLGWPILWLATLALSGRVAAELSGLAAPFSLLPTFLVYFAAAIPEEVAWRGFALPRLQTRFSALASGLIAGLLWGLWHLPLLWNLDNSMSAYPVGLYVIDVIGRSIFYTWLYNNTRGSLLLVTLFHAVSNAVGTFVGWQNVAVTWTVAAGLVLLFGAAHLSRTGSRPIEKDVPLAAPQAGG